MTCIVGLRSNGFVYLGGDSQGTNEQFIKFDNKRPKVFKAKYERFVIGFTDSFRMGQILKYCWEEPCREDIPGELSFIYWMHTTVINSLIKVFKENNFGTEKDGITAGGQFLLGYRDSLFVVEKDFSLTDVTTKYLSIGCGSEIALGSLHSTTSTGVEEGEEVSYLSQALRAAKAHSAEVSAPFHFVSTDPEFEDMEVQW